MEAISHAGTAIGILASQEGIVLAAERKMASNLFESDQLSLRKIYSINQNSLLVAVAGITSDANMLVKYARQVALKHESTFCSSLPTSRDQPLYVPVEQFVQHICNLKQGYTQMGGLRPFGASIIYAGYDDHFGFQLYQSDPSGNYAGWKATAMGANTPAAQSILKNDYPDQSTDSPTLSLQQAQLLAIKVLKKTMETTHLKGESIEMSLLKRDLQKSNRIVMKHLSSQEVDDLIKMFEESQQETEYDDSTEIKATSTSQSLYSTIVS